MKLIFVISFCFIFFYYPTFSQGLSNDSVFIAHQIDQSIQLYDHFMGAEADIYKGREYIPYTFRKKGSPFFESDTLTSGWIGYDGRVYQPVSMQYDVARSEVVIINYNNRAKIFLQNELIDSFHFSGHTFIQLNKNPKENLNNTGFYDRLFNGHVKLFADRKESIKDVIEDDQVVRIFYNQDRFYIYKANTFYLVNNKKDVFRLFNEKKHEIKQSMRQRKIKFRRNNFEEALIAATTIYDQH